MQKTSNSTAKFLWLTGTGAAKTADTACALSAGDGFVTALPHGDTAAYGTTAQLREGALPGLLVRASALVQMQGAGNPTFVLVTDTGNDEPGRWRFPCAYVAVDASPVTTARTALSSTVGLRHRTREDSLQASWDDAAMKLGGELFSCPAAPALGEFRARRIDAGNTVEFYYPMHLGMLDPAKVEVFDKQNRGILVRQFTASELFNLSQSLNMTNAARRIWAHAIAERVLAF